uniref:Uncharacterized protein n=2 Tax=Rhizophora mucronata TaxID=61149 RepID=A0A2P2IMX6_RHIMU
MEKDIFLTKKILNKTNRDSHRGIQIFLWIYGEPKACDQKALIIISELKNG